MNLAKILPFSRLSGRPTSDEQPDFQKALIKSLVPIQRSRKNYVELDSLSEMLKTLLSEQGRHLDTFSSAFNELASSADEISATNQAVYAQAESSLRETEAGAQSLTELKEVSRELSNHQQELDKVLEIMGSIRDATHLINGSSSKRNYCPLMPRSKRRGPEKTGKGSRSWPMRFES